ncbi:hypothetical protein ACOMHN_034748 [Nucella lapillus]
MATRIPITKEANLRFDDHQKRIWEEMETGMERRRREWEGEIDKMRKEFFTLCPEDQGGLGAGGLGGIKAGPGSSIPLGIGERLGPRSRLLETSSSAEESRGMVVKDDKGNPVFKVLFDVHDYRPEEVSVRMDSSKVMVSARHEAMQGGSSVSREFSRQVNIPPNIDPLTLQCTMGPDGVLAVEAPLPAPSYSALKDSPASLPVRSGSPSSSSSSSSAPPVHQSSSSYQTSSYQRGADPGYPAGYKPVSTQLQNSAPPPPPPPAGSSSLRGSPAASSLRDASSSGYSKVSPPFQALSSQQAAPSYSPPLKAGGSGGRMGSPVLVADPSKFRVEIDIEDFKPEELTVKTQDKRVVVCAKRQEKVGLGSSTRELSRERSLPDSVDPLTIKAFFTDGGKLIVEAPYIDAAAAAQSQASGR